MFKPKLLAKEITAAATLASILPYPGLASEFPLEEVIVSAQKRAQSIQDVGIAVTAFNSNDILESKWKDASQIGAQTPNLDIKNTLGSSNPVITIRGVGLNDFNPNNNPTVGVYVDEVFLNSPALLGFQLFDIERIEVLKGPQGTLYGRNTTGGAVNFVSRKPTEEFEAYIDAGYGNYETYELTGAVGGGLSENLAGRVAFTSTQREGGHIKNRTTGNDEYGNIDSMSWRSQLVWTPNDDLEILLGLHGGRDRSDAQTTWVPQGVLDASDPASFEPCAAVAAGGWDPLTCSDVLGYSDGDGDPYSGDWNKDPKIEADSFGGILNIRKDFSTMSLISITGYQSYDRLLDEDADGSPAIGFDLHYDNSIDVWSQELRLVSENDSNVSWIVGAFYSEDEVLGRENQLVRAVDWFGTDYLVNWEQTGSTAAAFGHTEWQMNDQWKLTAGLRYTYEEKSFTGGTSELIGLGTSLQEVLATDNVVVYSYVDDDIDDTDLSGKIALDYTPNEDWLIYASYSKGYKSGGFNGGFTSSNDELEPYDSEELRAMEVGFKSTMLDSTLQFNAAAFYYDYEGMQLFSTETSGTISVLRLSNGEGAKITGLDMDLWWRPLAGLDLKMGAGIIDSENEDPEYDGFDLPNAPELSVNGLVRYQWSLTQGFSLAVLADFSYQDEAFKTVDNKPQLASDSYTLWNGNLILTPENEQWSVSLWGKNLGDEEYVSEAYDQSGSGNFIFNYGMPRTYGVSFTYNWH